MNYDHLIVKRRRIISPSNSHFSLEPTTAATFWNSADKTAGLVLSNSDRTVTYPSGGNTNQGIRSVAAAVASQKVYIEHVFTSFGTSNNPGFAISTSSLANLTGAFASPSEAFALTPGNGNFSCTDSVNDGNSVIASCADGDRVDVAFDTALGLAWFRKNGGGWNSVLGGAQDPAAGTGGVDVPFAGPYYAFVGLDANDGDTFTTNFATASWVGTAPTGFTQLAA
jgi:hypothetical protein